MTLLRNNEPVVYVGDQSDQFIEEGGTPSLRFYLLLQDLAARVPIYGTGDPNGQFDANAGRLFVDTSGAQGSRIWMKTTNGGKTGWEIA